jgi:hypothetical protein
MNNLLIEKFIDSKCTSTINVPLFVLGVANNLLPSSAISALAKKCIDLPAIILANKHHLSYSSSMKIKEHGIEKSIAISLH